MNKILYVSDLDGTLLNINQNLDLDIIQRLNNLIDKGINFTISSGRGDSAKDILNDVHFKLPIMLLNGSVNYDFKKRKYIDKRIIPSDKVQELIKITKEVGYTEFVIKAFRKEKIVDLEAKKWTSDIECISINIVNDKERMLYISEVLSNIEGINFFIHKSVYSEEIYYCDITQKNVSKASAMERLKKEYNFNKVIAFGDSQNDLPLMEVADEFYAVGNAIDIVKKKATGVIGSAYEGGVVEFMESRMVDR